MKRYHFLLPFFSVLLFVQFAVNGSASLAETEDAPTAILLMEGRRDALISHINAAQHKIQLASPFFSDPVVQSALVNAHDRGVPVTVYVTSKAKTQKLQDAKIPVIKVDRLHSKISVIDDVASLGSDNWSQVSHYRQGGEMTAIMRSPRSVKQMKKIFDTIEEPKRPLLATPKAATPKKPTIMPGDTRYKANRLRAFIKNPSSENALDVFSMGFDSDRFVCEVEKVYAETPEENHPRMRFFLDRSASCHPKLLNRLKRAGGKNLRIYIYNVKGDKKLWGIFPDIAHQKAIARKVAGATHLIISTGNLVGRSDTDINYDYHRSGDTEMYQQLTGLADQYAQSPDWTEYAQSPDSTEYFRRSKRLAQKKKTKLVQKDQIKPQPRPKRASRRSIAAQPKELRRSKRIQAAMRKAKEKEDNNE